MIRSECSKTRRVLRRGVAGEAVARHLFVCRPCAAVFRGAAALAGDRAGTVEPFPAVDEAFVRRVVAALREDRRRRVRNRKRLAVAAAVLFFFSLGAGHQQRATTAEGAEEAYAQLVAPSVLDILPD